MVKEIPRLLEVVRGRQRSSKDIGGCPNGLQVTSDWPLIDVWVACNLYPNGLKALSEVK